MEQVAMVVFAISIQGAIGIMFFVAMAKLFNKEGVFKPAVVTAALLSVIGLLMSLIHLGRPMLAYNALTQFGSSWLSREIWCTSAFSGLTVLAALLLVFKPSAKRAIHCLLVAAGFVGIIDLFVMASIYHSSSILAWQHVSVYIEFYAAAVSMGGILFIALTEKEAINLKKVVLVMIGIAIILQIVFSVLYYIQLGSNESMVAQRNLISLKNMGIVVAAKYLLLLLGVELAMATVPFVSNGSGQMELASAGKDEKHSRKTLWAAGICLIGGQLIGRYLFYVCIVIGTVG